MTLRSTWIQITTVSKPLGGGHSSVKTLGQGQGLDLHYPEVRVTLGSRPLDLHNLDLRVKTLRLVKGKGTSRVKTLGEGTYKVWLRVRVPLGSRP